MDDDATSSVKFYLRRERTTFVHVTLFLFVCFFLGALGEGQSQHHDWITNIRFALLYAWAGVGSLAVIAAFVLAFSRDDD